MEIPDIFEGMENALLYLAPYEPDYSQMCLKFSCTGYSILLTIIQLVNV